MMIRTLGHVQYVPYHKKNLTSLGATPESEWFQSYRGSRQGDPLSPFYSF